MSILSQPGITARDLKIVYVVGETPNEKGEEYAPTLGQIGEPIEVVSKPLSGRERFQQGKQDSTVAFTLYADLEGSEYITPKVKIWHPDVGKLDDEKNPVWTEKLLDVRSVQRFEFGENIAVVEVDGTF